MNNKYSGRFTSKGVPWTDDEMILVLGYYFFIYQHNTRVNDWHVFADHLREKTGNNRQYGSVGVRFGNYNSVDPAKTSKGFGHAHDKCLAIWEKCIDKKRNPKDFFVNYFLSFVQSFGKSDRIYSDFLNKYSKSFNTTITTDDVVSLNVVAPTYKPIVKDKKIILNKLEFPRDPEVKKRSIVHSNFKCELNENHFSFISSKNNKMYVEAHHLIPIKEYDKFDFSIDCESNIVCLCPNCHRKLHFGKDISNDLLILFNKRFQLLKKQGINITYEELLGFYDIKRNK